MAPTNYSTNTTTNTNANATSVATSNRNKYNVPLFKKKIKKGTLNIYME